MELVSTHNTFNISVISLHRAWELSLLRKRYEEMFDQVMMLYRGGRLTGVFRNPFLDVTKRPGASIATTSFMYIQ